MNSEVIVAFNQYQQAQSLSIRTIKNREFILRPLARFTEKLFTEMTTADLRSYLARGEVKASTLRIERAAMVALFAFLEADGYRDDNPALRLAPVKVPRREPRPFSNDQIEAMLSSGAYKRTRAMIMLGYYQGFRVSQIANMRGDMIDYSGDTLRTVAKGAKERHLPLHPAIRDLAQTMPDTWWFPSPHRDGPIRSTSVTDAITEAKRRAGITDPRLTPHSLRHSFGTALVDQGVDIRVVQELMLHEDISTTQIYTSVSDARKREGIVTLDSVSAPLISGRGQLRKAA
ncbi:tyrosine-type recombinase/integrase [Leucobacter sp. NPDC077196]|uniref:tyrosine-type recombinase/integrase n=1 Tax=Leucobacter sp. NPDC077196 TaxID=3154959 RepID=UPI003413CACD